MLTEQADHWAHYKVNAGRGAEDSGGTGAEQRKHPVTRMLHNNDIVSHLITIIYNSIHNNLHHMFLCCQMLCRILSCEYRNKYMQSCSDPE